MYDDFPDHGFPRVHVDCDYKGVTQNDDLLRIGVAAAHVGNSSFTYAFHAASTEGREIAQGKITVVCLSKVSGRPTAIPDALRRALQVGM